jgi:hypothetical protein
MTTPMLMRRNPGDRPFRVRAADGQDIGVISAYLQDAIVPIRELAYRPKERRFAIMAQRFRWEKQPEPAPASDAEDGPDGTPGNGSGEGSDDVSESPRFERVHCALRFEKVTGVRSHGIDRADRGQMLSLLAITASDGAIDLSFAENKTIRLEIAVIDVHAEDIGEPWPTVNRPHHDESPEAGRDPAADDTGTDGSGSTGWS